MVGMFLPTNTTLRTILTRTGLHSVRHVTFLLTATGL